MSNKTFVYPDLETERLQLHILTLDDAESVYEHFSDSEVTRFMDIEPCKTLTEAEEIIQFHIDDSGCRWGIFYQGNFAGTIGFHYLRKNETDFIAEIGFDLAKKFWGKGLMTEAIREVIYFGFSQMGLTTIDATVEPENDKSLNLMNKLGFQRADKLQDDLVYFYLKKDIEG